MSSTRIGPKGACPPASHQRQARTAPSLLILLILLILPWLAVPGRAMADEPGEMRTVHVPAAFGKPIELTMRRAGTSQIDLRTLPQVAPEKFELPEREQREPHPVELPGGPTAPTAAPRIAVPLAAAPPPSASFDGLDFATWGAGHPPDPVGDAGPTYYIQAINTSIGIYAKNGTRVAAFTFNTLMSQGSNGNLCDTDNFGDPVVLYDTFEDRWIVTDFAFKLNGGGKVIAPAYQCFAVSKTSDPVAGGWWFYTTLVSDALNDYEKFGM